MWITLIILQYSAGKPGILTFTWMLHDTTHSPRTGTAWHEEWGPPQGWGLNRSSNSPGPNAMPEHVQAMETPYLVTHRTGTPRCIQHDVYVIQVELMTARIQVFPAEILCCSRMIHFIHLTCSGCNVAADWCISTCIYILCTVFEQNSRHHITVVE